MALQAKLWSYYVKSEKTPGSAELSVHSHTAEIVQLTPRDNAIPGHTGIPLIDVDPKVVARLLRPNSWDERAKFFNNIAGDSLDVFAAMTDYVEGEENSERFGEWVLLCFLRAIGDTLRHWAEDVPTEPAVAALFGLSLDPMHRRAARSWAKQQARAHPATFRGSQVTRKWRILSVLYHMCSVAWPGQSEVWREGIGARPAIFSDTPVSWTKEQRAEMLRVTKELQAHRKKLRRRDGVVQDMTSRLPEGHP